MWILLTLAVACLSGLALKKLKIPGGLMVGAILGVTLLNLLTEQAYIYPQARVVAQSIIGAYIGSTVSREDLHHMPRLIRPFSVMLTSLLCLSLCMASFIYWVTDFDLLTCLFCASPGGMSDTPLVAMDMGADGSVVAVMQFVRMVFGVSCMPGLIVLADHLIEPDYAGTVDERAKTIQKRGKKKEQPSLVSFLPTFCLALAAGALGKKLGIPAGALSFSMVMAAALKLSGKSKGMPSWLRQAAQVLSGCCIGCTMSRAQLLKLPQLALPAVVLCLGYVTCCILMGLVISKVFRMELREAMLAMTPAGASEMALISADMGIESPDLIVLHICRLVSVTLIFPHIFNFLVHILA